VFGVFERGLFGACEPFPVDVGLHPCARFFGSGWRKPDVSCVSKEQVGTRRRAQTARHTALTKPPFTGTRIMNFF